MAAVEGKGDPLLQEFSEFTFKCVGCAAEQKFNHQRVYDLARGQCVSCAVCDLRFLIWSSLLGIDSAPLQGDSIKPCMPRDFLRSKDRETSSLLHGFSFSRRATDL